MTYFVNQNCRFIKPVVAMGTFDGVHLGHQKLLKLLVERAKQISGQSVIITYFHHPLETIHRQTFPYLLTEKRTKEEILKSLGIDCVLYLNFNEEIAALSPGEFLEKIIIGEIHAKEMIVGYDTHFGKDRRGNYQFLTEMMDKYNFKVDLVPPLEIDSRIISSSIIRDYIREGDMVETSKLLGRDYSISGIVRTGHKIGRGMGFPTINIIPADKNKLIPALGVYLCRVKVGDNLFYGLTNVGYSPTLKTTGILEVETYIIDFNDDLYGREVEIRFIRKLRDELNFESKEKLIEAINGDLAEARKYFKLKEKNDVLL
jgi:riboflavin kinase / FMN adenylyltransferase